MKLPREFNARLNEKANGWKNNPKILSEITTYVNENGFYVEDESEFMEAVDLALEFLRNYKPKTNAKNTHRL